MSLIHFTRIPFVRTSSCKCSALKKKRNDISIVLRYSSMCLIYFVLAVCTLNALVAVVLYTATLLVPLKAERAM
jgi:hypothetical protein